MSARETQVNRSSQIVGRLEAELRSRGIDTLLMLSREDSDGVLARILDTHVVAQTAIFFNADGRHLVLTGRTDAMAYEGYPFFDRVVAMEDDFPVEFARVFDEVAPAKLALNVCEDDAAYDGLRWGLYAQLEEIVGAERLHAMEVSSADLVRSALE